MTNGAAAQLNALKAIGPVVFVAPEQFLTILSNSKDPLVVQSLPSLFAPYKYLTSHKGLTFFTRSKEALLIPASTQIITAKKISVPQV